ncbi:MAG: ATP-binding protein [Mycobacteriales bacterium]
MVFRLPISVRLALLFAASLAALLALLGLVVYQQLGAGLRSGLDQQLVDAAGALPPRLNDAALKGPGEDDELAGVEISDRLIQIVDERGQVTEASDELDDDPPLLDPASLTQIRSGTTVLTTIAEDEDDQLRVLGVPYGDPGTVAILAAELDEVDDAQQALLAVYGPLSVLGTVLAGALGYVLARRSLMPLRRMTAEAEAIGGSDLTRRLSPPARLDEIGRLTRTLNGMLGRLESALNRERSFAADASHELRTPLAILRAEVELARDRIKNPTARASLDTALAEAARLGELVDDLLLLARADAGHLADHRPIDLDELVEAVTSRFSTLATRRGVHLTFTGVAVVRGSFAGLERAVGNLVDNALRHTPEGGTVGIEVRPTTDGADIVVQDTGPGVPEDQLPGLFDRFSRLDSARHEPGGAGLGLAIVAAVAAAHSGTVTAANKPTQGLAVTLTLRG